MKTCDLCYGLGIIDYHKSTICFECKGKKVISEKRYQQRKKETAKLQEELKKFWAEHRQTYTLTKEQHDFYLAAYNKELTFRKWMAGGQKHVGEYDKAINETDIVFNKLRKSEKKPIIFSYNME